MKVQEAKGTELPERIDAGRDTTGRDEQSLEFLRKVAGPAVFTALLFALHPVHAEVSNDPTRRVYLSSESDFEPCGTTSPHDRLLNPHVL